MSTHPLVRALKKYQKTKAKVPKGCWTFEDCRKKFNLSEDGTRKTLKEMVDGRILRAIPGTKITSAGQAVPCTFYALFQAK